MLDTIKPNPKLLILGAGFGGHYTLSYLLKRLKGNKVADITLINETNYFLFTPILHEAATGVIETSHIVSPLRQLGNSFHLVKATVADIDLKNKKVTTSTGSFEYDLLVIAVGSEPIKPTAFPDRNIYYLKTLRDSWRLKNHIVEMFEKAAIEKDPKIKKQTLSFVLIGGGYAGTQLAASLYDVTCRYFTKYYDSIAKDDINIYIVEAKDKIMGNLIGNPNRYIEKHLENSGIQILKNSKVTSVGENYIEINSSLIIPTDTIVWNAGVQANSCLNNLAVKKDDLGRIFVDQYLEVPGYPGVYAVGDCIHYQAINNGNTAAPRAHNAVRQARIVAYNLASEIRNKPRRIYHFKDSAEVISLGRSKGLLRLGQRWIYGLPAIALFVISYSLLAVGKRNRWATLFDWLLSRMFGPYISPIE